jgi:hypothetical protein
MEADRFVKDDTFYEIPMWDGQEEHNLIVNAKYDSIHVQKELGIWILKCMDDKDGLIQVVLGEEQARKIAKFALLPIIERSFLYKSEHEMVLDAYADRLDEIFGSDD